MIVFTIPLCLIETLFAMIVAFIAIILSPLLALIGVLNKGYLPKILSIFQMPDNPVWGDDSWAKSNPSYGKYRLALTYLIRNPAYGLLKLLKAPIVTSLNVYGNPNITDGDQGVAGYYFMVSPHGWFQFWWIKDLGNGRCVQSSFGWAIKNYAAPSSVYGSLICNPLRFYNFTQKA